MAASGQRWRRDRTFNFGVLSAALKSRQLSLRNKTKGTHSVVCNTSRRGNKEKPRQVDALELPKHPHSASVSTNAEGAVAVSPYTGTPSAKYNVAGSGGVGTNNPTSLNMFADPAAVIA